ncbi:sodium:calcium antiporter [Halopseudomonas sp.]|uniref:sodium:calcium antiporter n=1 Tax=Halopseudomonas sp. TaxID=2901191 RepID=UPI001A5A746E|nr:sodium:calcium antiporter [Pseudomonas sp.]
MDAAELPLWQNIGIFIGAGVLILIVGTWLAGLADRFADRTGMGEAMTGTVFLGLVTSLPGLTTSITAAIDGRPSLAISNALGGIAVQTAFLGLADISYSRANLEHAVASVQNMMQIVLLAILLSMVLLAFSSPELTVAHVHPVSPAILLVAGFGIFIIYRSGKEPMWQPSHTRETVADVADENNEQENLPLLALKLAVASLAVILAGVVVARTTGNIVDQTGMSEVVAGALLSGVVTSLPELVTSIAAVRRGALTLAVADITGGNFFDVLFLFAVDVAYLSGSAFHSPGIGAREVFMTALILLLNMILLLGLIVRQRSGPGNIGLESVLVLTLYLGGASALAFTDFAG